MAKPTPKSYLQTDSKWSGIMYSVTKDKKQTIGTSGCGPSCMAMVNATLSNAAATPKTACKWAYDNGYRTVNSGTSYAFFKAYGKLNGIEVTQLNGSDLRSMTAKTAKKYHDMAKSELKKGNWLIAVMGPGLWTSAGHFILPYALDGANVLIRDPNSTRADRVKNKLTRLQAEVKYYWVINVRAAIDVKDYKVKLLRKGGQPARADAGDGYAQKKVLPQGNTVTITKHKFDSKNRLWGLTSAGWIYLGKTSKVK